MFVYVNLCIQTKINKLCIAAALLTCLLVSDFIFTGGDIKTKLMEIWNMMKIFLKKTD